MVLTPVNRMRALLYYANAAKVARGLTEKGYSVSGATVWRWAHGKNVTPLALQLVADLLGTTEEAAPDWGRLMRTVDAIAERVGAKVDDPLTDALHEARGTVEPPTPDEDPPVRQPRRSVEPR
jgi:hypothetical protein